MFIHAIERFVSKYQCFLNGTAWWPDALSIDMEIDSVCTVAIDPLRDDLVIANKNS